MTDVLSVVPARGGSKGIPRKNLRLLDGKPLVAHQIEASVGAELTDETIVSTDDPEIAAAAEAFGASVPFERPAELADDDVPVIDAVKHAAEYWRDERATPTYVLCLQPTSPFTTSDQIDEGIRTARASGCDSVVAVERVTDTHPYRAYRLDDDRLEHLEGITREAPEQRQDRPDVYGFTGAIYVRRAELLFDWDRSDFALGDDVRAVLQEEESSVEIDTPFQLRTARALASYEGPPEDDIWNPADE